MSRRNYSIGDDGKAWKLTAPVKKDFEQRTGVLESARAGNVPRYGAALMNNNEGCANG